MRDSSALRSLAALALLAAAPAAAQRVDAPPDIQTEGADVTVAPGRAITVSAGVAATRLTLGEGFTVNQVAVPVRVRVPIGQRFGVGLQTRYVSSGGETPGGDALADLSGFGDAELSLSAEVPAGPAVVIGSLIASAPLGERGLGQDAFATAALLSRDDLALDVPGLGGGARIGPALTVAVPLGADAAFGVGVSALVSSAYEPFADTPIEYAPAPETALTGGYTQTSPGGSTFAFDVTYVLYGEDGFGESVYSPGDKIAVTTTWQNGPGFISLRGRFLRDGTRGDGIEVAPARPVQASVGGGVTVGPTGTQVALAVGARYYGAFGEIDDTSAALDLLGKQQLIFEGGVAPRVLVSPGVTLTGQLGYSLGLGELAEIDEIPPLSGIRFGLGVDVEL